MQSLKSRIANFEQNDRRNQPAVIIVGQDETPEQAIARVNPRPGQFVIIVDRGCQHVQPSSDA